MIGWFTALKFLAPIAAIVAMYFYAHDAGWNDRNALVAGEIKLAVDAAVEIEESRCSQDQKLIGGINDTFTNGLAAAGARYIDAIDGLRTPTIGGAEKPKPAKPAIIDHGAAGDNRLYYADPGAARAAVDRAFAATKQAYQLTACQAYINGILKADEP